LQFIPINNARADEPDEKGETAMRKMKLGALLAVMLIPGVAFAQSGDPNDVDDDGDDQTMGPDDDADDVRDEPFEDDPQAPLPESKSDDDPAPPVAYPGAPVDKVVEQAGTGGAVGYGRAGVLELGGSAGFTAATDLTQINITPSIGWFIADNLELSARFGLTYIKAEESSATMTSLVVEPSYHLPFNRTMFGFMGLGVGASHVEGPGLGFAMSPRIGANFLVGRSGILTPAIAWEYTTHDAVETADGMALLAVSSAITANVGYTVMW
jgi:hypothetical protein